MVCLIKMLFEDDNVLAVLKAFSPDSKVLASQIRVAAEPVDVDGCAVYDWTLADDAPPLLWEDAIPVAEDPADLEKVMRKAREGYIVVGDGDRKAVVTVNAYSEMRWEAMDLARTVEPVCF